MQRLKDGLLRQIKQHKIGLGCFAFLLFYDWLIVNNGAFWSVNPVTYSLYALDYSMGFCSRILPGAVYKALIGVYEYAPVSAFVTVFYLFLAGLASSFMERFFEAAAPKEKKTCLVLIFLFLAGPFTFGIFIREFGMLDLYWAVFFALGCLLLPKKRLKWLLPLCFIGLIFVHFAALLCYAAVLLLLLFFFAAKTEDKTEKRQYYLLFALCFVITVGLSGYFIQFESENAVYPVEEFNAILRDRGVVFPEYLDSTLYRITDSSVAEQTRDIARYSMDPSSSGIVRFVQWLLYYAWGAFAFSQQYSRLWFFFLLELPLAVLLIGILISYFKHVKGSAAKRFCTLLMILLFFGTSVVAVLFTTDNVRWFAHAIIGLFICTYMILYYDYRAGFQKVRAFFGRAGKPAVAVYALVYALVSMDPYS